MHATDAGNVRRLTTMIPTRRASLRCMPELQPTTTKLVNFIQTCAVWLQHTRACSPSAPDPPCAAPDALHTADAPA